MNRDELMQIVKQQMPEHRWRHTLGVAETASRLAQQYGGDSVKADLAALLHDYAKYWPKEALRQVLEREQIPGEWLSYDVLLWHAPVAAFIAEHEFGIRDEEVLNAILYHTTGRPNMTLLEKIIVLSDFIEPGRDFPGVEQIRTLAGTDLDQALVACYDSAIRFLLQKRKRIYPLTIAARNDLLADLDRNA